jgi:hypothetical protein
VKPSFTLALVFFLTLGAVLGLPDPASMPLPPSLAANPTPKRSDEKVQILVDTIPGSAKFILFGLLQFSAIQLEAGGERQVAAALSDQFDHLPEFARSKGANLVVFLSREHGLIVPIRQSERPLILQPGRIALTILLFDWNPAEGLSEKEKKVRFVINAPVEGKQRIDYGIELKVDTVVGSKGYWVYGNISRFVKDAAKFDLDTVSITSSGESLSDDVWLPGCDRPLKVALFKPKLNISIFKHNMPNQLPDPTSPSVTPPAGAGGAPSVAADH